MQWGTLLRMGGRCAEKEINMCKGRGEICVIYNIPLLANPLACQGFLPIIEAFAKLTGISMCALFGLCGSSYVILSIPQCLNLLKSCMVYNV